MISNQSRVNFLPMIELLTYYCNEHIAAVSKF